MIDDYDVDMSMSNEDIDKKLNEWHESDSELPCWEYIGITEKDYAFWVEDPNGRERFIDLYYEMQLW